MLKKEIIRNSQSALLIAIDVFILSFYKEVENKVVLIYKIDFEHKEDSVTHKAIVYYKTT